MIISSNDGAGERKAFLFREVIAKRLALKNFDVTTAATGEEAVASAEKGLFDVAVVDFQMPGMDGAQVLKILKEKHKYKEIRA